ncbi:ATP-binding protein [Mesobacillus harenae]|uniref:ATP-binding protein n=1 Tax=Mesobacillus harenae TaxID=2213203 RepID=UPI001F54AC48|nr:ATP-binding protein [Mesobacillus harenae]
MDPNDIPSPKSFLAGQDLYSKRKEYSEILSVISYFSNKLLDSLIGTPILVVVSDEEGYLLDIAGDEAIKSAVESLGIELGSRFTQEDNGTNVISLALQQGYPISLIGEGHYHKCLHEIACYGTAFHYTDENSLLGTISIMTPINFENPLLLTMISQVVESIERELLLRKQNRKLNILNQVMLSRTKNGIVITDEKGIITEFNEYALKSFGKSRHSVIGKSVFDFAMTGGHFQKVLEEEAKYENEDLKFINKAGDQIVYLFDVQPIYEDEKVIGAFGQFRDITERFLMEEKIKEAEKETLAGRIAAGIAHEIRNPLTTVRGYLQFLNKEVDERISHLFSTVLIPEIDRANKIISDFLSISKPSYREVELIQVEPFILEYISKFLNSESLLHNAEVFVEVDPAIGNYFIQCNREEMLQVFINLFRNSLQAKGDTPLKVSICTSLVNSHIQFKFRDNGNGIPSAVLPHIFEPFFSTKDEGTGLGLSVSRKIVENHDGIMEATSSPDGTTFLIELPYMAINK